MNDVDNLEGQFTLQEYKEAYTMMDLNIHNMTKEKVETCGFVPFMNYFSFNDDSQTFVSYDDTMKGFVVIARKFIPRGESINLPAPYN